ncbi:NUDIX domain-containing protein [Nocardiopsis sp. Huas11]|uniref:NUDIX hydrolase n=1 Tax=Nocardiopsis sp. Huas11 TaxID=2183912 RepID=UPI000EACAA22|nr:NUDIX domain-containing protein [Nocardiopsis sp. Huas11]
MPTPTHERSDGGHAALSAHVFLVRGERVLMTRRGPDVPYAPGLWHAGVAGKAAPGEDVVAAAVRESAEELGIGVAAADLEFAHVVHSHESLPEWVHFFFVCRAWSGTPVNREPDKHTEIAWWPARELPPDTVDYCAQAVRHLLAGEAFSRHRPATARSDGPLR